MENNELILVEEGQEVKYRILFSIEDVEGKNYIVYTKENGNIKLISIKNDKEWKFIVEVLNSIQNGVDEKN